MKLGELWRKIYRKKDEAIKSREKGEFDFYNPSREESSEDKIARIKQRILTEQQTDDAKVKKERERIWKIRLLVGIILGVCLTVFLLIFSYRQWQLNSFSIDKVKITVMGEDKLVGAKESVYKIIIENNNRRKLTAAKLSINYSPELTLTTDNGLKIEGEKSASIDLGTIKGKSKYEKKVLLSALSAENKDTYLSLSLQYNPANFSSRFEKKFSKKIMVHPSNLIISLIPTAQVAKGEKLTMEVLLDNKSNEDYKNLLLKIKYPRGFTYQNAEPEPNSIDKQGWVFNEISPGEQKKIKIFGTLDGVANTVETFRAEVSQVSNSQPKTISFMEATVKVISSRLKVRQEIFPQDIYASNIVRYKIRFKNVSEFPLRDLILTTRLNCPVIDKRNVAVEDGFYDSQKNKITWKASEQKSLKLLEPNEEGSVFFSLKILDKFPMTSERDKNFSLKAQSEIYSLDVDSPIGYNKSISSPLSDIKINSDLKVKVSAYFVDELFENTGPTPLKAEEETTLTMKLEVFNTSNDLKDVILATGLPVGISWKNKIKTSFGEVSFNNQANEINWRIPKIEAGKGFLSKPEILIFQIGVKPSINQIDQAIKLLNSIIVKGQDTFVQKDVQYIFNEFYSNHADGLEDGRVRRN